MRGPGTGRAPPVPAHHRRVLPTQPHDPPAFRGSERGHTGEGHRTRPPGLTRPRAAGGAGGPRAAPPAAAPASGPEPTPRAHARSRRSPSCQGAGAQGKGTIAAALPDLRLLARRGPAPLRLPAGRGPPAGLWGCSPAPPQRPPPAPARTTAPGGPRGAEPAPPPGRPWRHFRGEGAAAPPGAVAGPAAGGALQGQAPVAYAVLLCSAVSLTPHRIKDFFFLSKM